MKTMRVTNPADLNTVARLREFLLGRADSRRETNGVVSLEILQVRHAERVQSRAALPPSVSGVVVEPVDPVDAIDVDAKVLADGIEGTDELTELLADKTSGDPIAASGQ